MLRLLEDDPSLAALVNVIDEMLRYRFDTATGEDAYRNLLKVSNTIHQRYPDLASAPPNTGSALRATVIQTLTRMARMTGGFRRKSQTARFNRCVKGVRKTVTPRPKSTKEAAAIAICTKTLLHSKGRTLKKYRKGKRLMTQKLRRKRSD
jgi:hypothetical protein